jgi:hypothetical protein
LSCRTCNNGWEEVRDFNSRRKVNQICGLTIYYSDGGTFEYGDIPEKAPDSCPRRKKRFKLCPKLE